MPSTHIIIVNYNAGEWLQRSVASALANSEGRVTVVDNASLDSSVEDTQQTIKDSRLNWVLNEGNRGFAVANNQVLRLLEEDFAVLLNPDCELAPNTLRKILVAFDNYPEMGLASCLIIDDDGRVQATGKRRFPTPWSAFVRIFQLHRLQPNNPRFANFDYGDKPSENPDDVEFVEAISGAFMVVRASALNSVGLLDEQYFMHCEDLDWCKRFALAGWKVGSISSASVTHAKGVSSNSRPIGVLWNLHAGMLRFFDKFYFSETAIPLRWLVKFGIGASFILRALLGLFRQSAR